MAPRRPKPLPEYVNIAQLSQETGILPRTLSRWYTEGKLPRPDVTTPGPKPRPAWARERIQPWIDANAGRVNVGRGRPLTRPGDGAAQ